MQKTKIQPAGFFDVNKGSLGFGVGIHFEEGQAWLVVFFLWFTLMVGISWYSYENKDS